MADINSVLSLEKCLPNRNGCKLTWQVLDKKQQHTENKARKKRILPLSILVKIKGPPKVLDSYQLTKNREDILGPNREIPSCTPMDLTSLNRTPNPTQSVTQTPDKSGLAVRPVLAQNRHIPGRYFARNNQEDSRPATFLFQEPSLKDINKKFQRKSASSRYDFNRAKAESTNAYNQKIYETRRSLFEQSKYKSSLFAITFNNRKESVLGDDEEDCKNYFIMQKSVVTPRHVTFPERSDEFTNILKGTSKAIHKKDNLGWRSAPPSSKESTSKVHFEDMDNPRRDQSTKST